MIEISYIKTPAIIFSVLQILFILAFIFGLAKYKRNQHYFTNNHTIDDAVKLALVKNWYWQYASYATQGLGMATVNFLGWHRHFDFNNESRRVKENCTTHIGNSSGGDMD